MNASRGTRSLAVLVAFTSVVSGAMAIGIATVDDIAAANTALDSLRVERPRLFSNQARVDQLRSMLQTDPDLWALSRRLVPDANRLLTLPAVTYNPTGGNMLSATREAQLRIMVLAVAYKLQNDPRYADRALLEMDNAANLADWNSSNMLDVAELTLGMAFGYDWLHAYMSSTQRTKFKNALITKGLNVAMASYTNGSTSDWKFQSGNVNIVANAAVITASLALGDENRSLAVDVIANARRSVTHWFSGVRYDGSYVEGVDYWAYAVDYLAIYYATLESATGGSLGISLPNWLATFGDTRVYHGFTPAKFFNYGNSTTYTWSYGLMWLAGKFNRPDWAYNQRQYLKVTLYSPLEFLWWKGDGNLSNIHANPPSRVFTGTQVAFLKSNWSNDGLQAAFKGGNNNWYHNHQDLGTFVLDALGERFAVDLGPDSYSLPGYFDPLVRQNIYRLGTYGQNTLCFGGMHQAIYGGDAPMTGWKTNNTTRPYAIADLSTAMPGLTTSWRRGMRVVDDSYAVIQDEYNLTNRVSAQWQMHTRAGVMILGRTAVLTMNGKQMTLVIQEPRDTRFRLVSATQRSPQNANAGITKLVFDISRDVNPRRVVVVAIPNKAGAPSASTIPVTPLNQWPGLP